MKQDLTLAAVVVVALFFDFTNGFHDTANAVATSVSTRAMSPRSAVLMASVLNFLGAFVSLKVAATVATGIVDPDAVTLSVVLAGLVGAITWNLFTWLLGLPSSSSHALIGGIMGAAIAAGGPSVIEWDGVWEKVIKPGISSPILGFLIALALMLAIFWVIRKRSPTRVNRVFRRAQIFSGGFVAFTHGTNDAQKTMGIISLALITTGHLNSETFDVPTWVIASSATAMALGTYVGGWKIINTMGSRIAKIEPPQGFAAQTACAGILWTTAHLGFPVSTTQTISGCVMGAGASRRLSAVRWGIAGNIVTAWILTLPLAGLVGALMEVVTRLPGGDLIVFLLAGVIAGAAFLGRRSEIRRLAAVPMTALPFISR
jgi:PiT family inorganic phosphate transporter